MNRKALQIEVLDILDILHSDENEIKAFLGICLDGINYDNRNICSVAFVDYSGAIDIAYVKDDDIIIETKFGFTKISHKMFNQLIVDLEDKNE